MGKVAPLKLNNELVLEAEEMVTLPPEAATVIACVSEFPTLTLPKLRGAGAIVSVPVVVVAVPLPDIDSVAVLFDALLANDNVPEALPLLFGANTTLKDALCPAAIVTGKLTPLRLNSELVLEAEEMVTLAPDAVTVIGFVAELPTFTLPKLRGAGAIVREPVAATLPPVPVKGTVTLKDEPMTNTSPPAKPAAEGVKVTCSVALWPAFRVNGRPGPLTENSPPLVFRLEMTALNERLLVSTTGSVELFPTATVPKLADAGVATRACCATPVPPTSTAMVGSVALLLNEICPAVYPPEVGAKFTPMVTL